MRSSVTLKLLDVLKDVVQVSQLVILIALTEPNDNLAVLLLFSSFLTLEVAACLYHSYKAYKKYISPEKDH